MLRSKLGQPATGNFAESGFKSGNQSQLSGADKKNQPSEL